ncbi:hypothetical protein C8F01DRAFT_717608 [Mycena amicta]|nr:hypothetical protein C8F01DRAFT_717608 [Mycena amicta]
MASSSSEAESVAAIEANYRRLPLAPPPNADASLIRGNLSTEDKQVTASLLALFILGRGAPARMPSWDTMGMTPFGGAEKAGGAIRLVEVNVVEKEEERESVAEMVCELDVTLEMCNVYGVMHGAFSAFLMDNLTVLVMVVLGRAKGFNGRGMSQSMAIHWHSSAALGETVRITARSVYSDSKAHFSRCEARNVSQGGRLVVSATNNMVSGGHAKASLSLPAKL